MITDEASLHAAINAVLQTEAVPANAKGAVVVVATPSGARLVISRKVATGWDVDFTVGIDDHAHIDGGIAVKHVWT